MDIIKDTANIKGDKDGFVEDERLHEDIDKAIGFKIVMEEEAKDAAKKKVTGVEEEEKMDDLVHTQGTANKNEAELNVFEMHSKPEGVGTMKKEKDWGGCNFESEEEKKEVDKKQAKIEAEPKKADDVKIVTEDKVQ